MNVLRRPTKEFCDIDQKFDVEFDQCEVLAEKAAEAQREGNEARLNSVERGVLVVLWRNRSKRPWQS